MNPPNQLPPKRPIRELIQTITVIIEQAETLPQTYLSSCLFKQLSEKVANLSMFVSSTSNNL